jgi:V-type H+-transporting ATPase subunit d
MPGADVGLGGLSTFNMQHGFVEALVRGMRSGFLDDESYHHLSQCENLEVNEPNNNFFHLLS